MTMKVLIVFSLLVGIVLARPFGETAKEQDDLVAMINGLEAQGGPAGEQSNYQ